MTIKELIATTIKNFMQDKPVFDMVFNPDSERLLIYYRDSYTTKSGKTSNKYFELGVPVYDRKWRAAFKENGINANLFCEFLDAIVKECGLNLENMDVPNIGVADSSFFITPYKQYDAWTDIDSFFMDWLGVCTDAGLQELIEEIKAL